MRDGALTAAAAGLLVCTAAMAETAAVEGPPGNKGLLFISFSPLSTSHAHTHILCNILSFTSWGSLVYVIQCIRAGPDRSVALAHVVDGS